MADKPMTVARLLHSPDRWVKGKSFDSQNCRYCLGGAIGSVYAGSPLTAALPDGHPEVREPVRRAMATIEKLFPHYYTHSIVSFNDNQATTFEDVLAVIREANL